MAREEFSLSSSSGKGLQSWCEADGCVITQRLWIGIDIRSEKGKKSTALTFASSQEVGQKYLVETLSYKKAVLKPEVIQV